MFKMPNNVFDDNLVCRRLTLNSSPKAALYMLLGNANHALGYQRGVLDPILE